METWTMASLPLSGAKGLPLSGAKGHDDGGRQDAGVPQANRETGMANRKQGITRKLAYLTSQCARRRARKAQKGAIFGGNKAKRWFRMSHLIQKWPKNKANFLRTGKAAVRPSPLPRKTKPMGFHKVRRNSKVAATIMTAVNANRNARSPAMATSPVSLSRRLLKAWTA